jgi:DNA-binding response OmpR family regulator
MGPFQWDQVDVLLVDSDRGARNSLRDILYNLGFREVRVGSVLEDATEQCARSTPDLLIGECEFPDGGLAELVSSLRHHTIGDNPFLSVIALTWTPTQEKVKSVIEAGVDDVLTKPIAASQLMDRVRVLIEARRKFVVTSDYIGPDRHTTALRENVAPLIDAPNTLKAKARDGVLDVEVKALIGSAISNVNGTKLECQAVEIGGLVDLIVPNLGKEGAHDTVTAFLDRLFIITADARDRSANTSFDQVSQICQNLIDLIAIVRASNDSPDAKHIKLLKPLSQAIRTALNCEADTTEAANRISQSLSDRRFFTAKSAETIDSSSDETQRPSTPPPVREQPRSSKAGKNRRRLFLLRLFISRISHLFGDDKGRKKVVPRLFVHGFDEYLTLLMGRNLYIQLNLEAKKLLEKVESDDDAFIWREIILNEQYRRFSFNILIRILIKFKDFAKNKRNFLTIINKSFDKKVDKFTESHFNIVFMTLFADIFGFMRDADELAKMDFMYGEGTGDKISGIYDEFKKQDEEKMDGVYSASDGFMTAAKDE